MARFKPVTSTENELCSPSELGAQCCVPPSADPAQGHGTPWSERGRTYIDDEVVSIIARHAAENVQGVHQLGDSALRALFSGTSRHNGIDAEVGMKEAAVDVEIVAEFGYPIREVAQELRQRIIEAVESMASRRVVEVNVFVVDVHVGRTERRRTRSLE